MDHPSYAIILQINTFNLQKTNKQKQTNKQKTNKTNKKKNISCKEKITNRWAHTTNIYGAFQFFQDKISKMLFDFYNQIYWA